MATFIKRGDLQWQAKIRKQGHPALSKTFDNRKDAENWALEVEREIRRGIFIDRRESDTTTFGKVLQKYLEEVTPRKKSSDRETVRIKYLKTLKLADYSISAIRPRDIAAFRDERSKKGAAPNTIRLDLACLSAVFEVAKRDWGLAVTNPVREIKQPQPGKSRKRRLESGEETLLLDYLPRAMSRSKATKEIVLLALETGMRQGELLRITWSDVDLTGRKIHLDDTKSGDPRDVPLSTAAVKILQSMPRPIDGGKLFSMTQDALVRGFARACALVQFEQPTMCKDLSFHDLRHEAASRWAGVLQSHELAKMFGWKTLGMTLKYYHPRAEDLAKKLG